MADGTIRPATAADADLIGPVYGTSETAEIEQRLRDTSAGTTFYLIERAGEVAAVFGLTDMPRLKPGTHRRLLLHELKLGARFRGSDVLEQLLGWLESELGIGTAAELNLLAPLDRLPEAFVLRGLSETLRVFRWAAPC